MEWNFKVFVLVAQIDGLEAIVHGVYSTLEKALEAKACAFAETARNYECDMEEIRYDIFEKSIE